MSRQKKLSPYNAKEKRGKFEGEITGDRKYATKASREEARIANRSLKKSARQQGKKHIQNQLIYGTEEKFED
jgi:hypothetical protein